MLSFFLTSYHLRFSFLLSTGKGCYITFKNNNFLSYCFFYKFVILFGGFVVDAGMIFSCFLLKDVISLLRAMIVLPLILKHAVSKVYNIEKNIKKNILKV